MLTRELFCRNRKAILTLSTDHICDRPNKEQIFFPKSARKIAGFHLRTCFVHGMLFALREGSAPRSPFFLYSWNSWRNKTNFCFYEDRCQRGLARWTLLQPLSRETIPMSARFLKRTWDMSLFVTDASVGDDALPKRFQDQSARSENLPIFLITEVQFHAFPSGVIDTDVIDSF